VKLKTVVALIAACACGTALAATQLNNVQLPKSMQKTALQKQQLQKQIIAMQQAKLKKEKNTPTSSEVAMVNDHFPYHVVTTTPYMGLRTAYDASDLLTNAPSMNEDLFLLQQRQILENAFAVRHLPYGERPLVQLSGQLAAQALGGSGFNGANSDINLTGGELDINAVVSRWAAGFMSISYDDAAPQTGDREANSRLYLQRGFLTLGNLNSFPVYLSVGQMYVPFGSYSSSMVTTALTQSLARIDERAVVLGISKGIFYGQVYGYKGDSYVSNSSAINSGGVNAGLTGDCRYLKFYDLGAGFVDNIADSQGMQNTGAGGGTTTGSGTFSGFGQNGTEALQNRVPAGDIHGKVSMGPVDLMGEYIKSLRAFNVTDLAFNSIGAKPQAMHTELDYHDNFWNKPFTFGVSYGETWQALGLNLPKDSYAAFVKTSLVKNTIEGLEFRHDTNYAQGDTAGGNAGTSGVSVSGRSRNMVTAQIGVYF